MSGRTRRTTGSATPDPTECPLFMECDDEDLAPPQKALHKTRVNDFKSQMKTLEAMAKEGAKVTNNNDNSVTFTNVTRTGSPAQPIASQHPMPASFPPGGMQAAGIPAGCRFLMDSRTGRIIGTINPNGTTGPPPTTIRGPGPNLMSSNTMPRLPSVPVPVSQARQSPGMIRPTLTSATTGRQTARPSVPPGRRAQPPQIVDLTRPTPGGQDKTKQFPALQVQPKINKVPPEATNKRSELDSKVKALLVYQPAKFTEWLIQHGLVPSEQYDILPNGTQVKLKLGLYPDAKKYPYSGGYVWLHEDKTAGGKSPHISVFRSSLFDVSDSAPTVLLKLVYHWCCQTNIPNVVQWVKVTHPVINDFFYQMRAVCVGTVQEELVNLGGHGKAVEVGVISLGTTTSDGNKREVRVEVMGVLDRETGHIRLRATEPRQGATNAERFLKILSPLPIWVQRNSKIITDFSVDKDRLFKLGFYNVTQCSLQTKKQENTNLQIMDYLKRVVPKMFQNTLSLLPVNVIQQFLDELTFREAFGKYPLMAFDNILQRIANQTSFAFSSSLSVNERLKRIADNPFNDWRMTRQLPPTGPVGIDSLPPSLRTIDPTPPPQMETYQPPIKRVRDDHFTPDADIAITKKLSKGSSAGLVQLEGYYYATLDGDVKVLTSEFKADMAFKCHLCKKVFMNNIEFMKHLSLHVEMSDRPTAVDLADLSQCKYCFKDFETSFAMQSHYEEVHLKKGSEFVCRICDDNFKSKNQLIHHMLVNHTRFEMPYSCQICGYRTSFHRDLVDHFQETHDRSDKLQCPRCLLTFSLFGSKGYNSSVASQFVQHMQNHQETKGKSSCKKCVLTFNTDVGLKAHLEKDHLSYKGISGVQDYQYMGNESPIVMPQPDERLIKIAAKKIGPAKTPQQQWAFAAQNLEDLLIYDVDAEDCCECRKKVQKAGHYAAYLCCTKCRYSTCCSNSIAQHVALFHGKSKPIYDLGMPVLLDKDVFCVCGFKTHSGNKMAKHLALGGCRTAYPTAEVAEKAKKPDSSASFPTLVAVDDEIESYDPSEVLAKAYIKQHKDPKKEEPKKDGPLAFLGLQRKSVDDVKENGEESKKSDEAKESEDVNNKAKENNEENESPAENTEENNVDESSMDVNDVNDKEDQKKADGGKADKSVEENDKVPVEPMDVD